MSDEQPPQPETMAELSREVTEGLLTEFAVYALRLDTADPTDLAAARQIVATFLDDRTPY